ncbi:MAG: hypothetical protein ACK4TJ_00770 [Tabrizicola sp.]|jgi:hypothetical protein
MTRRATLTQADLTRAIKAAEACGKVALWTPAGIAFVESDKVPLPSPDQAEPAPYDAWKAKREAQRARRA